MNARTVDPVRAAVAAFARTHGFTRKATSWYRKQPDSIAVLDLQKSQYGHQYYVNVALWLLPLGSATTPKENQCQIRSRLGSLYPEDEREIAQLLDLESNINDDDRMARLGIYLERVIPLYDAGATVGGLATDDGRRLLNQALVTGAAQRLIAGSLEGQS